MYQSIAGRLNSRELYTILLILLVGFASFGLGRLSKLQEGETPIRIEQASATVFASLPILGGDKGAVMPSSVKDEGLKIKDSPLSLSAGGQIVASRSGSKYHYPWCSGAQRISEANKVWFNSIEEARKAGYTPASNCKGLK